VTRVHRNVKLARPFQNDFPREENMSEILLCPGPPQHSAVQYAVASLNSGEIAVDAPKRRKVSGTGSKSVSHVLLVESFLKRTAPTGVSVDFSRESFLKYCKL
jgi:hypothetical protein